MPFLLNIHISYLFEIQIKKNNNKANKTYCNDMADNRIHVNLVKLLISANKDDAITNLKKCVWVEFRALV